MQLPMSCMNPAMAPTSASRSG